MSVHRATINVHVHVFSRTNTRYKVKTSDPNTAYLKFAVSYNDMSLGKRAYSNILKNEVSDKNSDIHLISAQNIDCGYWLEPPRRGGSNVYPQSKCLSRNKKKKNTYPCKPQVFYIKVGFKRVKIIQACFRNVYG